MNAFLRLLAFACFAALRYRPFSHCSEWELEAGFRESAYKNSTLDPELEILQLSSIAPSTHYLLCFIVSSQSLIFQQWPQYQYPTVGHLLATRHRHHTLTQFSKHGDVFKNSSKSAMSGSMAASLTLPPSWRSQGNVSGRSRDVN